MTMPGMPFEMEQIELPGIKETVRAYKNLPGKSLREVWLGSKVRLPCVVAAPSVGREGKLIRFLMGDRSMETEITSFIKVSQSLLQWELDSRRGS